MAKFVETGVLLIALRHLPIEAKHPNALRAAKAADCAGMQGRFWQMHEALFREQQKLADAAVESLAMELGLKQSDFDKCMANASDDKIRAGAKDAGRMGVQGTPTFFLMARKADGTLRPLRRLVGALPATEFEDVIQQELKALGR